MDRVDSLVWEPPKQSCFKIWPYPCSVYSVKATANVICVIRVVDRLIMGSLCYCSKFVNSASNACSLHFGMLCEFCLWSNPLEDSEMNKDYWLVWSLKLVVADINWYCTLSFAYLLPFCILCASDFHLILVDSILDLFHPCIYNDMIILFYKADCGLLQVLPLNSYQALLQHVFAMKFWLYILIQCMCSVCCRCYLFSRSLCLKFNLNRTPFILVLMP